LSSFDKASNPATSIVLKRFGMFLCVLLFRMTGWQFPLVSVDVVLVCSCLRVDSWRACEAVSMADESLQTDPCYMREQRVFKQTLSAYASYTADMSRRPGEGSDCLLPMAFVEICMPGPCWELTTLTPEEAETWCQRVFHTLIPDHLKKFLGVHRMSHILPYDYGTFKATCFSCVAGGGPCLLDS
jgi:hypothetical protein